MTDLTVLISGASRGLGAASARIAGQMHAQVALMARSEADLAMVADQVRAEGGEPLTLLGDVTDGEDCRRAIDRVAQTFGRLDALVNNAGVLAPIASLSDSEPETWKQNIAVNLYGPFLLTQAALGLLRESEGRIVNVSSGAAVEAVAGWSAYCAAKAAINHLTRVLAVEEPGVTTIAFRPGVVDTSMQAQIRAEGAAGMAEESLAYYVRSYEDGELLPPEVPACALMALAFHAPSEWSGAFLAWNHPDVQALVRTYACPPGA